MRMSMDMRFGVRRGVWRGFGRQWVLGAAASLTLCAGLAAAQQQLTNQDPPAAPAAASSPNLSPDAHSTDWSSRIWSVARTGDEAAFLKALETLSKTHGSEADTSVGELAVSGDQLRSHFAQRETDRAARALELHAELEKHLAEPEADLMLAKCLRSAIELEMIATTKGEALADPRIIPLIAKSVAAAHAAEARGEILTASELFVLLNALYEEPGTYLPDVDRLNTRLSMLRLYAPVRLYDMRVARSKLMGEESKMAPYNPLGDDYTEKLKDVDQTMVLRAIAYSIRHVEKPRLTDLLVGGLANVRTLLTTSDLSTTFPTIADDRKVNGMLAFLDSEIATLKAAPAAPDIVKIDAMIDRMKEANGASVNVPTPVLLHEFGNGVMSPLDDYSVVIWPDEVRRFEKNTQGKFVGVGIQIEYDELSRIRVATPLEGTPAQRAGVHTGDVLTSVNGQNVYGLTLDQAVDVITGPAGTSVTLTMERKNPEDAEAKPESIDFKLTRSIINVITVKGWNRINAREDGWEWFIDKDNGIGYVRLLQFTDTTADELARAISDMQAVGLKGLVFDLRFNPGGLMDQAVKVSRKFIAAEGDIVMARNSAGVVENHEKTRPAQAVLANTPVVVLINEGSASASEIVSGALACYARNGEADVLLLGERSFGKGSVQNVWRLTAASHLKLTVQYYMLPDQSIIHRRPGASTWGVQPDFTVDLLPKQTTDALTLRRDADIIPLNENGVIEGQLAGRKDPNDLLSKGTDLQLETALFILKARAIEQPNQASKTE